MKKLLATILLVVYIAFSSGVVISLHYCMDRLDSSKLGAVKSEICDKCGMNKAAANGCCHDEVKLIKILDDQKTASIYFTFNQPQAFIDHSSLFVLSILPYNGKAFYFTNHSPPLSRQDTYLQNCVFRI